MAYHGHKLLEEHIVKNLTKDTALLSGKVIIEVGSVREHMEGQNSTGFFMELCKKHNMKLISVDMDGFDYYHNMHSEKRKEKYKEILQTEITNENSWKSHLDMVEAVYQKGNQDSLLCIDDVFDANKGKGCTAVPFLMENGWKALEHKYNAVIFSL